MTELKNNLEIFKILPKTNCRECGTPACLAFSMAVIRGEKPLSACPYLSPEVLGQYTVAGVKSGPSEDEAEQALEKLRGMVAGLDLAEAAKRIGGINANGKLTVRLLGKPFNVDSQGVITANCHVNRWLSAPLLHYSVACKGLEVRERWMPLRDLRGGADWYRLFGQRCERPFKQVVDNYTGLFEDMIDVFEAEEAPGSFDSDIAVVIYPLPKLPMLICYWRTEEGMESELKIFFDETAPDNLPIESIYTLGVGILTMFEKIAQTHGK